MLYVFEKPEMVMHNIDITNNAIEIPPNDPHHVEVAYMDFPHDARQALIADFLDAIDEGRAPVTHGREVLKVQMLIDKLPGAAAAMAAAPPETNSGGMFGGGIMAAGTRMMAAGLSMAQIQAVTRETIGYAREKVGEDAVGEIEIGLLRIERRANDASSQPILLPT